MQSTLCLDALYGLLLSCALKLYRVYQEQSAVLGENVMYIKLHQYKQTYLYPQLNSRGDIGEISSAFND
jgi:hypothetical protein